MPNSHPLLPTPPVALFEPGRLVQTPGSEALMAKHNKNPLTFIGRHLLGDWGDVSAPDAKLNKDSLEVGERLMSVYLVDESDGSSKIYVISDAGEEPKKYYATTVLLPEEY